MEAVTVRELIVHLLDTPMDAEVEILIRRLGQGKVTGIEGVERPGGSSCGQAYVTLSAERDT